MDLFEKLLVAMIGLASALCLALVSMLVLAIYEASIEKVVSQNGKSYTGYVARNGQTVTVLSGGKETVLNSQRGEITITRKED